MAIKILTLEGLQDSRLGELLCQLLETVPGVNHAKFDFLSRKMTLDLSGKDSAKIIEDVTALMKKTFPKVTIKRTEVAEMEAAPPPPPPPKPREIRPYFDPDDDYLPEDDEEDFEELSEEPAGQKDVEEAPEKPRLLTGPAVRAILSLVGMGLALALFLVTFLLPFDGILRDVLCGLAYLFSAASIFLLNPARGNAELRAFSIVAVLLSGVALILGDRTEAMISILLCQAGLTVVTYLASRLDQALENCLDITPERIEVLREGRTEWVPRAEVLPGSRIIIRDGMTIPYNGVICDGITELDKSLLTGQREPVHAEPGDEVRCGDRNQKATIMMDVTGMQEITTAWKIRQLLLERKKKGGILPPRWTVLLILTLVLLSAATGTFLLWGLEPSEWLFPVLLLLLNAAPCGAYAAAEAIRTAGMLNTFHQGVILNGEQSMDSLSAVDMLVTGYTGVFTEGSYRVSTIEPADDYSENEVLRYAAFAESDSQHPIAQAILAEYEEAYGKGITPKDDIAMCEEIEGQGVRAMVERRVTFAGSERLMREMEISVPSNETGNTCVYVAVRGEYIGRLVLEDALKPGAEAFAEALAGEAGAIHSVLLTGCDGAVARSAANRLGIEEVMAERGPAGKAQGMEELLNQAASQKQQLLYVGDGSDLAMYSVSCARILLGSKAIASMLGIPDAILPSGDPSKVLSLLRQCRNVNRLAVFGIFGGYALKWILLGCALFLPIPLYGAILADIIPSVVLFLLAYRKSQSNP